MLWTSSVPAFLPPHAINTYRKYKQIMRGKKKTQTKNTRENGFNEQSIRKYTHTHTPAPFPHSFNVCWWLECRQKTSQHNRRQMIIVFYIQLALCTHHTPHFAHFHRFPAILRHQNKNNNNQCVSFDANASMQTSRPTHTHSGARAWNMLHETWASSVKCIWSRVTSCWIFDEYSVFPPQLIALSRKKSELNWENE